jgi:hypothetical protein
MFGLMKRAPRLPYCGTCKTLGALYGQRSRILLNHDTVFLAELLFAHAGEPEWGGAYRSFNCLTLPREIGSMPIAVQYAASVTVALAHFHVADHFTDTHKFRWRMAARWLSPAYLRAASRLRAWQFPVDEVSAILASQPGREASPQSLEQVAEPTMTATALVFSHGFRLVGRPELAESMYRVGAKFGYLIYVLDAYEDRERDLKTGAFNPLVTFTGIDAREEILAVLSELERELEPQVPPELAGRLRVNVEERLGLRPRMLHQQGCRKPARDRWREAKQFARTLRAQERGGFVKGAAVLASVTTLAFLFPHQARRTESWRECLGVSMNLMALGAIFATPLSTPPPPPHHRPLSVHQAVPPKVRPGGGGFNCKDCCCEACGEGCCDACGEGCCSGCG